MRDDDMTRLDALRKLLAIEDKHDGQRTTRVVYAEADRTKLALAPQRRTPTWWRVAKG